MPIQVVVRTPSAGISQNPATWIVPPAVPADDDAFQPVRPAERLRRQGAVVGQIGLDIGQVLADYGNFLPAENVGDACIEQAIAGTNPRFRGRYIGTCAAAGV